MRLVTHSSFHCTLNLDSESQVQRECLFVRLRKAITNRASASEPGSFEIKHRHRKAKRLPSRTKQIRIPAGMKGQTYQTHQGNIFCKVIQLGFFFILPTFLFLPFPSFLSSLKKKKL